ncbi:hypothetical protein [Silvanigrella aquatica]|uniref:hypothetical protein n=1 Tax=Silvanigrella aquatica TaxID=1915309 RepID=UPI000B32D146|nr:hypothetical protein [Silvanigrella aquatica]
MVQEAIVYTLVILATFYLLYKWKFQKFFVSKAKKSMVKSCSSGCHSCPVQKEKKFS